jgi:hypothetical protein
MLNSLKPHNEQIVATTEQTNEQQHTKGSRQRYFHILIETGLEGPSMDFNNFSDTVKIQLLKGAKFVSQLELEKALYKIIIEDRDRLISVRNFLGQLQQDPKTGTPIWDIVLETKAVTTAPCVARSLTKRIMTNHFEQFPNKIAPTITVRPILRLERYNDQKRYILNASDWFPGFFSRSTVQLFELLKNDDIRQMIKIVPEKFIGLLGEGLDPPKRFT